MKKLHLFQFFAVVVVLMAVAVMAVSVKPTSASTPEVPFIASVSGNVSLPVDGTFQLSGDGSAIHLGNLRDYQAYGTFITSSTDVLVETLTAANGDTLTILCEQVLTEISPLVFRGTDTWTVIGGTGRFAGATGSGTGVTTANLNTGTFTKNMAGSISY